jgi:hypothetical protein
MCLSGCAWLTLLSLAILTSGCTTPYRHAQLQPPEAGFAGIDGAFDKLTPDVDVLLVHGIGTHDPSWALNFAIQLAQAMGFPPVKTLPTPDPLAHGAELYRFTLTDSTRQLHVGAVLWSPITSSAKKTLCYDVSTKTTPCSDPKVLTHDKRAWANGSLKSQLMDDALSDVTFYLNEEGGRRIRDAIEDALLQSLSVERVTLAQVCSGTTPTAKTAPLFLISKSLGSKIVVDSLQEFEDSPHTRQFARQTRGNVHTLFLLANQIPILNLGLRDASGAPDTYQHLKTFSKARNADRNPRLPPVPLHVVAFSDPNDLLSYQLEPNAIPKEDAIISNVVVSNAPTIAWLVENPNYAHTCYFDNSPVAAAIAHGSGVLTKFTGVRCSP